MTKENIVVQQEQGCTNAVSQQVCVEAVVTITPSVTPGTPMVSCVGLPAVGTTCAELGFTPSTTVPGSCTTSFAQVLCVTMPLTFNADVVATPGAVGCGPAFNQPNCPISTACTFSKGYFANNEAVTNALIASNGGSIVLGQGTSGLSLTATSANAKNILLGNAPIPPTPPDSPLRGQYQALYAQLLAARLNQLNGADCTFAQNTISGANNFLATSPAGGKTGAPAFTSALDGFNLGDAAGCPGSCEE
ncbi:hypothetical protein [Falsibacillus pallidus]|uniref:Uncharacterized protein n=1 Tax=Falsibacillus pallidus TaxID=493781 RepID=A0A370GQL9_9BACI|nr:hypothetical protein [Falsibacillus pallidus]RDI45610.1 hypothetical protein DFR59_102239 [Falsibacillus pallidus]